MEELLFGRGGILWLAVALGILFGGVIAYSRFCAMGAVADIIAFNGWGRMKMWSVAAGVSILGVGILRSSGHILLDNNPYISPQLTGLSHLIGGGLFGVGMVLASGCAVKNIVRAGGGSLKAVVVLIVMALAAAATMHGVFAGMRMELLTLSAWRLPAPQDIVSLADWGGLSRDTGQWQIPLVSGIVLLSVAFWRGTLSIKSLLAAALLGGVIVLAWWLNISIGFVAEHPDTLEPAFLATRSHRAESLSFVGPSAEIIELMMWWSDPHRLLSFGGASALGVFIGAILYALLSRSFRWEGFADVADLARHLCGAVCMGVGGVMASGCTVGQGLSGLSVLSVGAVVTTLAIIGGAAATLKIQFWWLSRIT